MAVIALRKKNQARYYPLLLLAAVFAAYANSLSAPFLFDDGRTILSNPHIRHLWPVWESMRGTTRPFTLLTLAINYAVGRLDPRGYHLVNVLIHGLAGLALYGVIRRTLMLPRLSQRYGRHAEALAFICALLWLVHPLQTESVTYTIQRAESLMGLWYLFTLYCVLRGATEAARKPWYLLAVLACALGMASKPVMVTAPLLILCYDWVFLAQSWKELMRARGKLYFGLIATWLVLLMVAVGAPEDYRGTVGFTVPQLNIWHYALTQAGVIAHYFKLSLWPHPLLLSCDWPVKQGLKDIPLLLIVAGMALASLRLMLRRIPAGFLGSWFFIVLAPTSSFFPITDPVFEHRMYLPLVAVIIAAVFGLRGLIVRRLGEAKSTAVTFRVLAVPAVLLSLVTIHRNQEYVEVVPLWQGVVARQPYNARAHGNLGFTHETAGRLEEAAAEYKIVIKLSPQDATAHHNLGTVLAKQANLDQAATHFREAIRLSPGYAEAYYHLGLVLMMQGQIDEGLGYLLKVLDLDPANASAMLDGFQQIALGQGKQNQVAARLNVWLENKTQKGSP